MGINRKLYRALGTTWGLYGHWGDKRAQWGALLGTGNAMGISGGL